MTVHPAWLEKVLRASLDSGYKNAMKLLQPLRTSSFLDPLTGVLIVEVAYYRFYLVLATSRLRLLTWFASWNLLDFYHCSVSSVSSE